MEKSQGGKTRLNSRVSYADEVPGFWEEARQNGFKKGNIKTDCDTRSNILYDQLFLLFNGRILPDGRKLKLEKSGRMLKFGNIRLSADNMATRFCGRDRELQNAMERQLNQEVENGWELYQQDVLRSSWRIGLEIVFPVHRNSLNAMRGFSRKVMDRFDITLEFIRRYYDGTETPLTWVFEADREWFSHFIDFRHFVDFFWLNDWVDDEYRIINQLRPGQTLEEEILPKTIQELKEWNRRLLSLGRLRENRMEKWIENDCPDRPGY